MSDRPKPPEKRFGVYLVVKARRQAFPWEVLDGACQVVCRCEIEEHAEGIARAMHHHHMCAWHPEYAR